MAIGVIWYPPVDQQTYDAVREKTLQAALGKGMRLHAAGEAEGSWRIIEIWDSRDRLESFMRETLHPAIDEVSGGQAPQPEPELVFEVYFQAP
jgi:quinol monooxygenase YgiN